MFGWLDRSIGAPVTRGEERYWLRVMSEGLGCADEDFWTGNADADAVTDIAKPRALGVFEWAD
ncbi:hypothetical protein LX83_001335 [Goodfellowiella coeruleoviolacea]|uniref:Uncharacterized protein n=1 Tax=Goodfellowiella coeruleoviolacea TaxID=334858 RepID=A0AAE3KF35_9PSEU|nr:hypothetical protein [Goodfellowiella coeruleoviolacea]